MIALLLTQPILFVISSSCIQARIPFIFNIFQAKEKGFEGLFPVNLSEVLYEILELDIAFDY